MVDPPSENHLADDEVIFRRIKRLRDHERWRLDGLGRPPVPPAYFRASPSDAHGLSLIRAGERHPRWAAFSANAPESRYDLAAARVGDIRAAGCTLVIRPDDLDAKHATLAHVELPEITWDLQESENKATKKKIKTLKRAVRAAFRIPIVTVEPLTEQEAGRCPDPVDPTFVAELLQEILAASTV